MQNTLVVNGDDCRTIVIDKVWNVVIDNVPHVLYRGWRKDKRCLSGKTIVLKLKSTCEVCGNEFFGFLNRPRRYCSYICTGKMTIKLLNFKRIKTVGSEALKLKARAFINTAIRSGKIISHKVCSHCWSSCVPDFHHPDYTKFNKGMWLCHSCHFKLEYGNKTIKGKLIAYNI